MTLTQLTLVFFLVGLTGEAAAQPGPILAGPHLVITVNFADRVKPVGGSYYIAFTVDDTILVGPQSDSSYWTHYVLYRRGRFFFGTVPRAPFRPFGFETIRPPDPYLYGEVLPEARSIRVKVPLTLLQSAVSPATQVKVNFVTVDDLQRPIDALGRGAAERFAFVTFDLLREIFEVVTDPGGDASDPSFDIRGGEIRLTTP